MSIVVKSDYIQIRLAAIAFLLMQPFVMSSAAFAQSIAPTQGVGSLGTQVAPDVANAQQLNITGGTQAAANLYHSFQQFGLTQGEIANFMSNPSIQNILARVSGGNPSIINGLVQVTGGNSNLYLLNPAGIIFGANSSLNVPAAFTATTASGIQVGNGWFGMNTGIDDVKKLTGTPQAFGFASSTVIPTSEQSTAAIANAGNLTAKEGQSIILVGGLVINTGTITTPSGKITIAAVPNGKYVKITPEGSLLSLELAIADQNELARSNIQTTDLPTLLTGSANLRNMTGLNVDASGHVLVAGMAIPNTAGTAIASGNLDVSSATAKGGEINVLGDRVGLVSTNLNASGAIGGGTVLIGGDLQGKGIVPNAQYTFISKDSIILADALQNGTGGKVIAWADLATRFYGTVTAKGGINSGDGGFVEVSGKNGLDFRGDVNTQATNGKSGTLLLDPYNLEIDNAGAITLVDAANLGFGADFTTSILDVNLINNAAANTTISLQARNNITFKTSVNSNFANVSLVAFAGNQITVDAVATINMSGDISLSATNDISIKGSQSLSATRNLSVVSTNGNISTQGLKVGDSNAAGSNISLIANNGNVLLDGSIQAGDVNNTNDSKVTIIGNKFLATNPRTGTGSLAQLFAQAASDDFPVSIIAFPKNRANDVNITALDRRSVTLQLPGDTSPRFISGLSTDPVLISITILKDTTFAVPTLVNYNDFTKPITAANVVLPSIPANGSGMFGFITLGASNIPPNVFVLVSDQSFSSNAGLANTLAANTLTLNSDAIASARTAELQANAGAVATCEPTGTKKPILNLTASLLSATVTRTAQSSNTTKLPPCKE
jgi:filamentous hemagglutinin family protein